MPQNRTQGHSPYHSLIIKSLFKVHRLMESQARPAFTDYVCLQLVRWFLLCLPLKSWVRPSDLQRLHTDPRC